MGVPINRALNAARRVFASGGGGISGAAPRGGFDWNAPATQPAFDRSRLMAPKGSDKVPLARRDMPTGPFGSARSIPASATKSVDTESKYFHMNRNANPGKWD